MSLQELIELDQSLLLKLNGSDSLFWDGFMWVGTSTYIWIPLSLVILYVIIKNNSWQNFLLLVIMLAIVVALADQISSSVFKPLFQRWRPAQDPDIMYIVDIVNGYRGGRYGFISSHAANSFAIITFLSMLMRRTSLTCVFIIWALVNCFTRIYLGVHYPGDILGGMILGILIGLIFYNIYRLISNRFFYNHINISKLYTKTGFLISDLNYIYSALLLTYFFIIVLGLLNTRLLFL